MKTITILGDQTNKVTDTATVFKFCLWNNGVPQDIMDKTVTATIANSTSYLFDEPLVKNGTEVDLDFSSDSLKQLVPDTYSFEINVINANGDVEVYPTEGNLQFTVTKNLRGTQGNLVPQVTFDSVLKSVDDKIAEYTATIAKGEPGKDGEDGKDGKDGVDATNAINVREWGAKGDGITSDVAIINQAFLSASLSPKINEVYIPNGKYLIDDTLRFQSNIRVLLAEGAVLYGPSQLFSFGSTGKGYGNGVTNVKISGGTFSGEFNGSAPRYLGAFCGALHHAENITFENVTFNMTTSHSHTLDLGGCRNIKVLDCKFNGMFNPDIKHRAFVEAIQIDYSAASGLTESNANEVANVDGLPSCHVLVKDCQFNPILNSDGSVKYYAPNPIGEHAVFSNDLPHDIVFDNNRVTDAMLHSDNAAIDGWIHFMGVRNLTVKNNQFINSFGHRAIAINLAAPSTALNDPINGLITNVYGTINNVDISNNKFSGFTNKTATDGLIILKGNQNNLGEGIVFKNNIGVNNLPLDIDLEKPTGTDFIKAECLADLDASDNDIGDALRFLQIDSTDSLIEMKVTYRLVNNHFKNIPFIPIYLDLSGKAQAYVNVQNNDINQANGFLLVKGAYSLFMSNNYLSMYENKKISVEPLNDFIVKIINTNQSVISNNNIIQYADANYSSAIKYEDMSADSMIQSSGNFFNGTLENK